MEIKLKNLYLIDDLSCESQAFVAAIFINGYKAAGAANEGNGDRTFYSAYDVEGQRLIWQAEEWCRESSADVTLEVYVDRLLFEQVERRDRERFRNRMIKDMNQGILIGVPDECYRVVHLALSIKTLLSTRHGIERLRTAILERAIPALLEHEKMLNTNIPDGIIRELGVARDKLVTPWNA